VIHCLQPNLPHLTRVWRGDGFITVASGSIRKIDYKLCPLFRLNGRQASLLEKSLNGATKAVVFQSTCRKDKSMADLLFTPSLRTTVHAGVARAHVCYRSTLALAMRFRVDASLPTICDTNARVERLASSLLSPNPQVCGGIGVSVRRPTQSRFPRNHLAS
jgi:hypothetical protein